MLAAGAVSNGQVVDLVAPISDIEAPAKDIEAVVEDLLWVKEGTNEVKIELPADILFDFDRAEIRPDAAIALESAAEIIRTRAKGRVEINGHTDSKDAAA